jgi:hypothetical protein
MPAAAKRTIHIYIYGAWIGPMGKRKRESGDYDCHTHSQKSTRKYQDEAAKQYFFSCSTDDFG